MTDLKPAPAPPLPEPRRIPGRIVVIVWIIFLVISIAVASTLRYRARHEIATATAAVAPTLGAHVALNCLPPGATTGSDLRQSGRCPTGGALEIKLADPAPDVKQLTYVLLSTTPQDAMVPGQMDAKGALRLELSGHAPGTHLLAFVFSNKDLPLTELTTAMDAQPAGDIPQRLVALETAVANLRKQGYDARTERLQFRVEEAKP